MKRLARSNIFALVCAGFILWNGIGTLIAPDLSGTIFAFGPYEHRASVELAKSVGETHEFSGTMKGEPMESSSGWRVQLTDLRIKKFWKVGEVREVWEDVKADVFLTVPSFRAPEPGTRFSFSCALDAIEPFNGYRYDLASDSRGIGARCSRPKDLKTLGVTESFSTSVLSFKKYLVGRLQSVVPEPHSGFLVGLVFGGSSDLPTDLRDAFSVTGLTHILSASGYNASLVVVVLLGFLIETRLGRKRGILATGLVLIVYVIATGAGMPMVRAGLMSSVVLLGMWTGRKPSVRNALLAAGAVSLAFTPLALLWDPSFQLSFIATAALLAWGTPIAERLEFVPEAYGIRASLSASLAAIIATTPIVLWHFGNFSFIAPIANIVVLPFVPIAMAATCAAIIGSWLPFGFASITALPAWALAHLSLEAVTAFSLVPYANTAVPYPHVLAIISGSVIAFILLWLAFRPSSKNARSMRLS